MNGLLEKLAESARARSAKAQVSEPLSSIKQRLRRAEPVRPFRAALDDGPAPRLIAELKKASPSRGVLREHFRPVELARELASAGAAALSILTEEEHFQGSLMYLRQVRSVVSLPLLRKDFILDEYEVYRSRLLGADAVLLIVALLSEKELRNLLLAGREAGIDTLVEVHDEREAKIALACGARLVGVNNRDLCNFAVTLDTSRRLASIFPQGLTRVCESGIHNREQVRELSAIGYRAFLVGEELMRHPKPGEALRGLRS
ncbi:MAG: indole-3-glycerol phosphate synthase TrpC [Acidobacteriota bacterium]